MTSLPDRSSIMRALAFLSRFPVAGRHFEGAGPGRTARDAAAFPLAGAIIALPGAAAIALFSLLGATALLAAALAVTATIAVTGALHEDGLGDTADGFGGGTDAEGRLAIMKDSRVGAYGVLALTASVLLRTLALGALIGGAGAIGAALAFIGVQAGSRAALVWYWSELPPARDDGVAAGAGQPADDAVSGALLAGAALFAALGLLTAGLLPTLLALVFAAASLAAFSRISRRLIDGQTGDTIGAAEQIAQLALLVGLAMAP
ncbi:MULTISPECIES: adenosylcobinamide-GDP ribazoletransferase [unclassified Roseitalea]|uniref:adenosylcobinamide-GDP ribazoletransferase n=1 Tax=unclassified Roseitalea TaxID=2639107 RepID=UPI00273FA7A5|nr:MULTISPECIES: adenosylcobinamide-GDP ribazoletransferase [unclassified Roseitalea]